MNTAQIQELAESILLNAMNGGNLGGMVFRHGDNALKARKTSITAKAGAPVPQLEGFRGFRVEVEIEIKTDKPNAGANYHAIVMQRILNAGIVRRAALSAGMTMDHDLSILDEEIDGDRAETKNLRKRSFTVPLLINTQRGPTPVAVTFGSEQVTFGDESHTFGEG